MHRGVMCFAAPFVVAVALTAARDGGATTCGRGPEAMTVPPPIGVRAPRNVRPRVTLHADWETKSFCPEWGLDRKCLSGRFHVEMRVAGNSVERVETIVRESKSGDLATLEIIPRDEGTLLEANTRYEIIYYEGDDTERPRIISSFMTGTTIDKTAPAWPAKLTSHGLVGQWPNAPPPPTTAKTGKTGKVVTLLDTTCEGQGIDFQGPSPATDGDTRPEDIRYGIWISDSEAAAIDYKVAPLAYAVGRIDYRRPPEPNGIIISLGGHLPPSDFSFPVFGSIPTGKRSVKVGIRAIDLAGNLSEPSEHVVKAP